MKSRAFLHGILYIESMRNLSTYMLLLKQEKPNPLTPRNPSASNSATIHSSRSNHTIFSRMNTSNSHRPGNTLELLPPTTSQALTQRPTNNLTPTILSSDRLLRDLLSRFFNRRHKFRLQSRGMDAVGVQTFVDELSADHPVREGVVGCEDVGGGERFVL